MRRHTVASVLSHYHREIDRRGCLTVTRSRQRANLHLLPVFGRRRVGDLTREHVDRYSARRHKQGAKPATVARELIILRAALRHGWKSQLYRYCPYVAVPRATAIRDVVLTPQEARRLLNAAASHSRRMLLFTALALFTAARRTAILQLTWARVGKQFIDYNVPGDSPRRKSRAVTPIPAPLARLLDRERKNAESDHVIEADGQLVTYLDRDFRAVRAAAGLPHVTPHVLRHTCASWLAQAGVPMDVIAMYLGHKDPAITRAVYAHIHPGYLTGAADVLTRMLPRVP